MNKSTLAISIVALTTLCGCKHEQEIVPSNDKLFPKVKAIVQTNCTVTCHAPSSGFMDGMPVTLETDSDIVWRATGIKSALVDPITYMNKRMPPNQTLAQSDVDVVLNWVAKGGKATD